ncbi:MAG: hypothetical protein Q8S13_13810, partial [Dehalococcoidia bacterium]|nr:hypothetical protein [Dehalococcoidia bacterium]
CAASCASGKPCRAVAGPGGKCFAHAHPAGWRDAARRGGAANKPTPPPVTVAHDCATVPGLVAMGAEVLQLVRSGRLDARTANAIAGLLGVQARLLEVHSATNAGGLTIEDYLALADNRRAERLKGGDV